jgi:Uma2 family endonuclease
MSPLAEPIYTPDEYLRLERAADRKSEFMDGRIYAMGGASAVHNQIVFNLARDLGAQLRGRPCRAYVNDMRVKVRRTGMYTYPDFVALCGQPEFEDSEVDTLLNPSIIIEVLSGSTEKYDRVEKFEHYRRLDTLCEYVLISQDRQRIEKFVREGDGWRFTEIDDLAGSLRIDTLDCAVALSDIYDQVEFLPREDRRLR